MKKLYLSALLAAAIVSAACYKPPEGATKTPPKSSDKSTPTAEKSASPESSNSKGESFEQALTDYKAKNLDKAEAGFKAVIAKDPKNADAHFYLGKIYVDRKDFQTSLAYLQEAAKIDYKSVEKLMTLGDAYFELKKYDTAIVQYGKIVNFEPNNAQAYYKSGLTYIGLKNKIAARQQLQKLESLDKELAEKLKKEIEK